MGRRGIGAPKPTAGRVAGGLLAAVALACGGCGGQALQTSTPPRSVSTARQTVLFDCGGKAHVAPSSLMLACADGGNALSHLRWRHWGDATATATGIQTALTCKPDCAAGGTTSHQIVVQVRQLKLAGTHATYALLRLWDEPTAPSSRPAVFNLTSSGPSLASASYSPKSSH